MYIRAAEHDHGHERDSGRPRLVVNMWMLLSFSALLGLLSSEAVPTPAALQQLQNLHCPPCERIHCSTRRALKLQCKGGVTTGVCGCCPVCARTEGETCGGAWDYLGKCDEGLVCVYQDGGEEKAGREKEGLCKAVIGPEEPETCHPDCTRDYCRDNPSGLCSARLVSLEKKSCQGSCQHVSCSSCLLIKPPPCTQTCGASDTACLQRFGKCVHHHLSHSSVCHSNNLQTNPEGHFVCLVPDCPSSSQ